MTKKSEGWRNKKPDDPKRHGMSARGIKNAPVKRPIDPMDKLASEDLTSDAFIALDDLAVSGLVYGELDEVLKGWKDRMTYRALEKALDRGLEFASSDTEDRILNALHTLDQESDRYAKSATQRAEDLKRHEARVAATSETTESQLKAWSDKQFAAARDMASDLRKAGYDDWADAVDKAVADSSGKRLYELGRALAKAAQYASEGLAELDAEMDMEPEEHSSIHAEGPGRIAELAESLGATVKW